MGALAKKRAEEAAAAAACASTSPEALAIPVEPSRPAPAAASPHAEPATPAAPGSPLGGIALAAIIFGVAVLAWHSAPWRAPQKMKIDPESLKLDRSLDLNRDPALTSPKGTTSPSRPS